MSVGVAFLVVLAAAGACVGIMLLVRRAAPRGGFFTDSDRAAGVFGVIGTSFAVLLAFVIFLAFESFDRARERASIEAVAVSQLHRTARLFSPAERDTLQGQLVCYSRAVVRDEWPAMRENRESPLVESWIARFETTIDGIALTGERQRAGYEYWFDGASDRREGRRGRLAEAGPFVPPIVWLALVLGGLLIVTYMCFYADRAEPAVIQALMMAGIATVVVAGILIVRFLDRPYTNVGGSIKPTALTQVLVRMEAAARGPIPCDTRGRPRT